MHETDFAFPELANQLANIEDAIFDTYDDYFLSLSAEHQLLAIGADERNIKIGENWK